MYQSITRDFNIIDRVMNITGRLNMFLKEKGCSRVSFKLIINILLEQLERKGDFEKFCDIIEKITVIAGFRMKLLLGM